MDKNVWIRMASALPICGNALALWIENFQMGCARWGTLLGSIRGLFIGLVIAVTLITASEVTIAVFDVVREWVLVNIIAEMKVHIRERAVEREEELLGKEARDNEPRLEAELRFQSSYRPTVVNNAAPFVEVDQLCVCENRVVSDKATAVIARVVRQRFKAREYRPEMLPKGTRYEVYTAIENDWHPALVIDDFNGRKTPFIGVVVIGADGQTRSGFIPRFEHECYLRDIRGSAK